MAQPTQHLKPPSPSHTKANANATWINPFRAATALLLIFCASHTVGGLLLPFDYGAAGNAVLLSMRRVHFDFFGADCTFDGFRMGFGLMVSVFLALSAAVAWVLGGQRRCVLGGAEAGPAVARAMRPIAASLAVAYGVTAVLAWRYFFVGPVVFSAAVAGCMGMGYWELAKAG